MTESTTQSEQTPVSPVRDKTGKAQDGNRIAVALAYEPGNEDAPRVTAKGQGHVAEQIVEVAIDHGVEIREDADLAQILSQLDVDSVIPVEVFATVAEILTYVYTVNRDKQDKLALARAGGADHQYEGART